MSKGGKIPARQPETVKTSIPIEKLQLLRKRPLTKKRQKLFLAEFAKTFNVSKAAFTAGISRRAVYFALDADPEFKEQFEAIKQAKLDTIEEASLLVATQVDARGFNDRKLLLQAHRPEVYNPATQVNVNQTLTINTAPSKVNELFNQLFTSPEITDAEVVEDDPIYIEGGSNETDLQLQKKDRPNNVSLAKVKKNM